MKKLAISFFVSLAFATGVALPVMAAGIDKHDLCGGANLSFDDKAKGCNKDAEGRPLAQDAQGSINDLIEDIITVISVIVGIVAVIMIIWGGFKFITSGGDAGRVTSARNTIIYGLIGLVIVALAQFIVRFVLGKATQLNE